MAAAIKVGEEKLTRGIMEALLTDSVQELIDQAHFYQARGLYQKNCKLQQMEQAKFAALTNLEKKQMISEKSWNALTESMKTGTTNASRVAASKGNTYMKRNSSSLVHLIMHVLSFLQYTCTYACNFDVQRTVPKR